MSNNYKDNAQDDLKELETAINGLKTSGGIKAGALTKYEGILDELKEKMKGYSHKDQNSKMKTCIFIDAENISVSEYESKYKKKIRKFAKNHGLLSEDSEVRAYAVEGGPTGKTWKSDGVSMKMIPGDPRKNKADNQIVKELIDKADKGIICLLVTHDKGLQTRINTELRDVYIFDE